MTHNIKYSKGNIMTNKKNISNLQNIVDNTKYDENSKRLLCNNIIAHGKCNYGDKCMYSHSLNEQKKDTVRELAYSILNKSITGNNLSDDEINVLVNDKELYKVFIQLTKICSHCVNGKCPGGYNCKYGVFDKMYQLCSNDLYDECTVTNCDNIHLSNIGLKFKFDKKKKSFINNKTLDTIKNYNTLNEPLLGTLLTEDFFSKNETHTDDSISDSDDSYDRINTYLNEISVDLSCDESIFIF